MEDRSGAAAIEGQEPTRRHLGLFGATTIGVGAIVGGGVLALAGVAFATTGPSAILAFALNGAIAFVTAASFAELARRFPESGGTYTYAKKVLSIEVAFVVGWVVWFASIVAGVLYALGFAAFAADGVTRLLGSLGTDGSWLHASPWRVGLALAATLVYTLGLIRKAGGGGLFATVGKVVAFAAVILGGAWAWFGSSAPEALTRLDPFLVAGRTGLIQAMGYTFIALQGFDLIAAVGGEVKDPQRVLPRSMYLSLAIALAIYLPLLFLISTVGAGSGGIAEAARANPEGLVAEAAGRFLGPTGYWLVIGAGVLSMLSALQANLLGASRVAFAMARDRTLPKRLGVLRLPSGTPALAVVVTASMMAAVVAAVGDVAAAGAASSLIFLVSFSTVHWAAILARRRSGDRRPPWLPMLGATLCLALGLFQAFAVPAAGSVVAIWLAVGAALYLTLLAPGARLADATAEARDPDLARLRGRSPLVLVPIANPASAAGLVELAGAVRTPGVGRTQLLSILRPPGDEEERQRRLRDAQAILGAALERSLERGLAPETLFILAEDPWGGIEQVANEVKCETVLVGLHKLGAPGVEDHLEHLMGRLGCDVVVARVPTDWRLTSAQRVLVPIGGRRDHSVLRARLLVSLGRHQEAHTTFLRVAPPGLSPDDRRRYERDLRSLAADEAGGPSEVVVEEVDDRAAAVVERARGVDLVVMGIQRNPAGKSLGALALRVAAETDTPLLLLSRRS